VFLQKSEFASFEEIIIFTKLDRRSIHLQTLLISDVSISARNGNNAFSSFTGCPGEVILGTLALIFGSQNHVMRPWVFRNQGLVAGKGL